MPRIGIIAGSGFYEIEGVTVRDRRQVSTPFGNPSDDYRICESGEREFVFLSRHGTPHRIPPHKINYRANLWGMKALGVERVVAINAVGGIQKVLKPGDIVIPDQVIDMTEGRETTYYDGEEVVHVDFTAPYCSELRRLLLEAGERKNLGLVSSGTYVCVQGPRLETKAEITYFGVIGGDVVGMTGMPEACLARELELCFGAIAVVTNPAAGASAARLTTREVVETMRSSMERVRTLLFETLGREIDRRGCACTQALRDATI